MCFESWKYALEAATRVWVVAKYSNKKGKKSHGMHGQSKSNFVTGGREVRDFVSQLKEALLGRR